MRARHRDRRGRGIRGPLAPQDVPATRSRSEQFDEMVLEALERLESRWEEELREVELAVEDVPPAPRTGDAGAGILLGQCFPATSRRPARIVVYRRPVESRARDPRVRGTLVERIVVEQVAELLGVSPEVVDPAYGDEGDSADP